MRLNSSVTISDRTHEQGPAGRQTASQELERAVSTCLLWEPTYYETGNEIAARIADLSTQVPVRALLALALKARTALKLRHAPLYLLALACAHPARTACGTLIAQMIPRICLRPDEMGELIALYWRAGRKPLPAAMKRGLAQTFRAFSAHSLAKWNRKTRITLRDVLFLVHAKPASEEQAEDWKQLINGTLAAPDTWEVALSSGADKKTTWERLLSEKKLGSLALLMNLRNMVEAGVSIPQLESAILGRAGTSQALPIRYVAAAKAVPQLADALSAAMLQSIEGHLSGTTVLLVDVSGSMDNALSGKSKMSRLQAAGAVAILLRELCASVRVFTFSNALVEVPNYRGFPLLDAIERSQAHSGTQLRAALTLLRDGGGESPDRLIVITDEQTQDGSLPAWVPNSYYINVAPYRPGLSTDNGWRRINGWSERIIDWIQADETREGNG